MQNPIDEYRWALSEHENVERLLQKGEEGRAELKDVISGLVPSGIYRHFKGTATKPKRYLVITPTEEVDTGIWNVSYMALYQPNFGTPASRPLVSQERGFLMPVDRKKYRGRRFILEQELPLMTLLLDAIPKHYIPKECR